MTRKSRRDFIKSAACIGLAGLTAGCSFLSGDSPNETTPPPTPTPTPTPPPQIRTRVSSTLRTSEFDTLQSAVDEVRTGGALLIDTDFTLDRTVSLRSDMYVLGAGGTVSAAPNTSQDLLRLEDVSNVVINGITMDGGWNKVGDDGNTGTRLIGGVNLGSLRNIRIRNCTLKNTGLNAIELGEKKGGTIEDVYIANNTIQHSRNHGIILWVRKNSGKLRNVIVENNSVYDTYKAQAIGVFGRENAQTRNTAFLANYVNNAGLADKRGTNVAFEELTRNNVAYGNEIVGNRYALRSGIGASKDADNNIIANNRVINCLRGIHVQNFEFYTPSGPPKNNLVIGNDVSAGREGFYYNRLDGDLHVCNNRITNVTEVIAAGGRNTGSNYTFRNNGGSVSASKAGVPSSIDSSVTYTNDSDTVVGEASWDRGSIDPDDPVSVSVTTRV